MHRLSLVLLVLVTGCATVDQIARDAIDAAQTVTAGWDTDASTFRGQTGRFAFSCPANPPSSARASTVWGSGPYTDDSSVCRAGVHAGAITYASGGRVTIELRPGQASYSGSLRNGVQSEDWGSWDHSFAVIR